VPVFAALVPVEWPVATQPTVYLVDLSTQLLGAALEGETKTLKSDYVWEPDSRESVTRFLKEVVPTSSARLLCSKGVVASIPTPNAEYVQRAPVVPVLRFSKAIELQLRRTAAWSVTFLFHHAQLNHAPEFRRLMASVVRTFNDHSHWESFWAQALSCHADNEFDEAARFYREAQAVINRDKRVRDLPEWVRTLTFIDSLAALAEQRRGLPEQNPG
jgi:hypothetical protein